MFFIIFKALVSILETFDCEQFNNLDYVKMLVDKYNPKIISCERLFYTAPSKGQRKKSASIITTNMVTGLVVLTAGENNLEFADLRIEFANYSDCFMYWSN
mgnify:CR=1 FL=1